MPKQTQAKEYLAYPNLEGRPYTEADIDYYAHTLPPDLLDHYDGILVERLADHYQNEGAAEETAARKARKFLDGYRQSRAEITPAAEAVPAEVVAGPVVAPVAPPAPEGGKK